MGQGKLKEALKLIQACNPLPDVTGRVCPQEHAVPGRVHHHRPADRDRPARMVPARARAPRAPGTRRRTPSSEGLRQPRGSRAEKPPIAVVGSGPAGLINAYLLSAEGYPVTVFEAFHDLGGVLRYGIPEFRLPNALIDDVVEQDRRCWAASSSRTSSSARRRPCRTSRTPASARSSSAPAPACRAS